MSTGPDTDAFPPPLSDAAGGPEVGSVDSPSEASSPDTRAFLGCPYPSGNVWQTDISSAPLATNSARMIQATITGGDTGGFNVWIPDNESINAADSSTPLVTVVGSVSWHTPYSPVPWEPSFYIEPASDGHSMVLQEQSCQYFEAYHTRFSGGELHEYNGGHLDLTKPFTRPANGGMSSASGIPIGLLAVRPEELSAGTIAHALGWGAVAHSVAQDSCVSPAGVANCTDGLVYNGPSSDAPYAMPYGSHVRLQASFDDATFPREAKIVAEALKHYGAYLYDTGCCDEIPFVNDQNGAPTWTSADGRAVGTISIKNFDVVQAP